MPTEKKLTEDELRTAKAVFMIHVHQATMWAEYMRRDTAGEIKFRINGGLGHFQRLCDVFEKGMEDDFHVIYEKGEVISKYLSQTRDDPDKHVDLLELMESYLNGNLEVVKKG